jgi:hypothetical protein
LEFLKKLCVIEGFGMIIAQNKAKTVCIVQKDKINLIYYLQKRPINFIIPLYLYIV